MCTYYYLHYHHVSPCPRSVEYALHYEYCPNSTIELASTATSSSSPLSPIGLLSSPGSSNANNHHQEQQLQLVQQPCEELTYAPEYYSNNMGNPPFHGEHGGIAYYHDDNNIGNGHHGSSPCATGGCLVSQHCSSGGCRLDDLGGRWTCCKCQRGGNTYRWCVHPMRRVPDTLCYHVVCQGCWADQ